MEQELAHLTRRLAELDSPTPLTTGDHGDHAVANEAHELLGLSRDRMAARARALAAALSRMDAGTYGGCELCDKPIAPLRLAALPETPFCVACARSLERDGARRAVRTISDEEEDE
jgi:RNA polymerase-binding transcription factor DksA